jgi:hypothetical protein
MIRLRSPSAPLTLAGVGLLVIAACDGATGSDAASTAGQGGALPAVGGAAGSSSISSAGSVTPPISGGAAGNAAGRGGADAGTAGSGVSGGSPGTAAGAASSGAGSGGTASGGTASTPDATWVPDPSWNCGMADGLVPPSQGQLVFDATFDLGDTHDVGDTQYGHRRVLDVRAGVITGDKLKASVLTGGLELELTLSNGARELEQLHMLRASDNTLIYLRGCGMAPAGASTMRFVPDFEVATSSGLAWLNTGKFVGTRTVDAAAKKIILAVYDVSKVTAGDPRTTLKDPTGVVNQPWDCSTMTGAKGDSVFTESVGIGASLSVGASKRGTRNVIPITGGSVTGRVTGKVLAGGADFQIVSGTAKLDARYTLASNDGEFIVIRNCGAFGALIPQFETRAAGPYAFLNANTFVSSDPGSAAGGVSITMYERK